MPPRCGGGRCHLADDPRSIPAEKGFAVLWRKFRTDQRYEPSDLQQIAWLSACRIYEKGHRGDDLIRITILESLSEWTRTYGNRSKWIGDTTHENLDERPAGIAPEPETHERPRILDCISVPMSIVLETVIVHGLSNAAAAEHLGIKASSVIQTVSRAKKIIRKHYDRATA
jgi:DNA-directed RNA polymerase specialized sigma24 family protein